MAFLTIFTPTYNRKFLLKRGYEALQRQTSYDFEWLIIDDGSTDDTRSLVNNWILSEKSFPIRYIYKNNGGLHTAYNTAIENLETPLAMCVDSDDFLPDNAVKTILDYWKANGSTKYAGIIGLDFDLNGKMIGDPLPSQKEISLVDVAIGKYKIKWGDRKLVLRSELYKKVAPMKVFPGEKNFNPNYLHMEISKNYPYLVLNKNLCFVDYQETGMSSNIWKQYYNSPQSFAELRKQHLSFDGSPVSYRFKEYVHYISCCFIARKNCGLKHNNPLLYIVAFPFGYALSRYVKWKNRSF